MSALQLWQYLNIILRKYWRYIYLNGSLADILSAIWQRSWPSMALAYLAIALAISAGSLALMAGSAGWRRRRWPSGWRSWQL